MKMDIVAGSGNDEFYTPAYAVVPILKYIPRGSTVWCPFDTGDSNFVRMLTASGCTVINTHIESGHDFFQMQIPDGTDFVISNPPYSRKTEVLERLFSVGIKFAMLVGVVGLFESQRRFDMFRANKFEVMYMNRRVSYFKSFLDERPSLNPPFSSVYICSGVLPSQIVFEEISK
jgi:hypothetical protein